MRMFHKHNKEYLRKMKTNPLRCIGEQKLCKDITESEKRARVAAGLSCSLDCRGCPLSTYEEE